ncbi:MAG: PhnD/SsuA/transferrin family substrate-binding protein [Fimbriiglobus sp.]
MSRRLFLAACLAIVTGATSGAVEPVESIQIGMVQGMFRDVQPAMVQAMAKPLRDLIRKQTGLTGEVDICVDAQTLSQKMADKKLHIGVYHGFEFAWVQKKNPNLVPLLVTVPPAGKFQAHLVVNKTSTLKEISELKNETVLIPRGTKAHCHAYLEQARKGLPETTAKPEVKSKLTTEEALDAVVSGDSAVALVDASALLGYKNLQPGAFDQLKVLCESDVFPQTVLAYQKDALDDGTVQKIKTLLMNANQNSAGKPLLMLWNLKGFTEIPQDYDAQLAKSAKAFPDPAEANSGPAIRTVGRTKPEK